MSLLALAAGKGSPGVTTAAVALASVWPRPAAVAETDPAGGDLALRLATPHGAPLAQDVGVVSLATAARGAVDPARVWEHTQTTVGPRVLVGPMSARQAQAMNSSWEPVAQTLAGLPDGDVLADLGRLAPGAAGQALITHADLVLLLARPTREGVAHLRCGLDQLATLARQSPRGPDIGLVLVTSTPQHRQRAEDQEVLAALGLDSASPVGHLAFDPDGAAGVCGRPTRGLDRTPLVGSARKLAHQCDAVLARRTTPSGQQPQQGPPAAGASPVGNAHTATR